VVLRLPFKIYIDFRKQFLSYCYKTSLMQLDFLLSSSEARAMLFSRIFFYYKTVKILGTFQLKTWWSFKTVHSHQSYWLTSCRTLWFLTVWNTCVHIILLHKTTAAWLINYCVFSWLHKLLWLNTRSSKVRTRLTSNFVIWLHFNF
jgi:hypothetical protein